MGEYLASRTAEMSELRWKLLELFLKVTHDFKDRKGRWIKLEFDDSKIMELTAFDGERKVGAYILHMTMKGAYTLTTLRSTKTIGVPALRGSCYSTLPNISLSRFTLPRLLMF
jgi:hypothetical protein